MIDGARRALRAASIFLLGVAAPLLFSASAAGQPAHFILATRAESQIYLPASTVAVRLHSSARACPHTAPAATCRAVLFHLASRAFAEDAPPPPGESLEEAQFLLPVTPAAAVRALSTRCGTGSFCVCNRQRAP